MLTNLRHLWCRLLSAVVCVSMHPGSFRPLDFRISPGDCFFIVAIPAAGPYSNSVPYRYITCKRSLGSTATSGWNATGITYIVTGAYHLITAVGRLAFRGCHGRIRGTFLAGADDLFLLLVFHKYTSFQEVMIFKVDFKERNHAQTIFSSKCAFFKRIVHPEPLSTAGRRSFMDCFFMKGKGWQRRTVFKEPQIRGSYFPPAFFGRIVAGFPEGRW
jgi:hypothetical protein